MNLLFVADDSYTMQLLVTLNSIFVNNRCPVTVYVYSNKLSRENQEKITSFVKKKGGICHIIVREEEGVHAETLTNFHWNPIVYLKLYAMFELTEEKRVLYLDCDTIVDGDIQSFYRVDMNSSYAAVVEDYGMEQIIIDYATHRKKLMLEGKYFNAGVMLLNLEKIQRDMTLEFMIDIFFRYGNLFVFNEQDLLNMIWDGNLLFMPDRYNRIATNLMNRFSKDKAAIYHYTMNKPWINMPKENRFEYCYVCWKGIYLKYCGGGEEVKELRDKVRKANATPYILVKSFLRNVLKFNSAFICDEKLSFKNYLKYLFCTI